MSTQLLIVSLCVVSGTFVGLFMSRGLVARSEYFKNILAFINSFMSEVKFRKQTTEKIIYDFKFSNKSLLNKDLDNYFNLNKRDELGKGILKNNELLELKKLFSSIGTLDSETQIFELENYKLIFANFYNQADEKRQKLSTMYIKLGFFAGLALGIILL